MTKSNVPSSPVLSNTVLSTPVNPGIDDVRCQHCQGYISCSHTKAAGYRPLGDRTATLGETAGNSYWRTPRCGTLAAGRVSRRNKVRRWDAVGF